SGLHSNGYSLVRRVILERDLELTVPRDEFAGRSLGEVLLDPTIIYAPALLALKSDAGIDVHAAAHVTGGAIAGNVAGGLPRGRSRCTPRAETSPPSPRRRSRRAHAIP